MTQWKKLLKTLGFTDSEAIIYLTSIEVGPAPVQDLARRAKVSRVTTYAVIESLAERGLMSSMEKGKKKLFVAESPERLVSFVHGRVTEMQATLKEVESTLNELKLMQKGEKPVVKLFEGKEALKAIEDDVLVTKPEMVQEFGNVDAIKDLYPPAVREDFFREFGKLKTKRHLFYLTKDIKAMEDDKQHIKVYPEAEKEFFGDIFIYGNKVALSTLRGKQISILIESQDIADTLRALFEHSWKKSS